MDAAGVGARLGPSTTASAPPQQKAGARFDINLHDIPSLRFPDQADTLEVTLAAFKAEASKTPTQRCREQVMKEWRVTPEALAAMPAREARQLERRIEAEVTRRLHAEAAGQARPNGSMGPDQGTPLPDSGISTSEALPGRSAVVDATAPLPS